MTFFTLRPVMIGLGTAKTNWKFISFTIIGILLASIIIGILPQANAAKTLKDTTPPSMLSTSPANGDVNVPVYTTITLELSEPIDMSTLTVHTFDLAPDDLPGSFFPGEITADESGNGHKYILR